MLAELDAHCQSMPKSTPFNNSALGPHKILWDKKQTGSSRALTSTLRALRQDSVPTPGISHGMLLAVFPRWWGCSNPSSGPKTTVTIGMNTAGCPARNHYPEGPLCSENLRSSSHFTSDDEFRVTHFFPSSHSHSSLNSSSFDLIPVSF